MNRELFHVRNIGNKKASPRLAAQAHAIELNIITPATDEDLQKYFLIEKANLPSYANTKAATKEIRANLRTILSGRNERWHLWEIFVYDDHISLHFVDMQNRGRTVTALSIHVSWAPLTKLSFNVPEEDIPQNDFQIECSLEKHKRRTLYVEYTDTEEDARKSEIYDCRPLKIA